MTVAEPRSTSKVMGGPTRPGITAKVEIQDETHGGTSEGYITGNVDPDGELREVFLAGFGKEGSTLDGWTQVCAVLMSGLLQAKESDAQGIFRRIGQMKFAPYGKTNDPAIPWVPSVPAYIVAYLVLRFGGDGARRAMHEVMAEWGE